MLITGREVARVLGLGRETCNRILAAGLAGPPLETGAGHLYDADRVVALLHRPAVDEHTALPVPCERGLLVARIDPRSRVPEGPWALAPGRFAVLAVLIGEFGMVPLVTTVGGFVVRGHDVTGYAGAPQDQRLVMLSTRSPSDWFAAFDGRALRTPPGNPLIFWRCRLSPPNRARRHEPWPPPRRTTPAPPPATAG